MKETSEVSKTSKVWYWSIKMKTVTVLDLQEKAEELVRSLAQTGEKFQIIENGELVAILIPSSGAEKNEAGWVTLAEIEKEIKKSGD
jgi:antitoxin (DNA-binding transcriptional repressor) of toxin-antitoxin stability system